MRAYVVLSQQPSLSNAVGLTYKRSEATVILLKHTRERVDDIIPVYDTVFENSDKKNTVENVCVKGYLLANSFEQNSISQTTASIIK